MTNQNDLWECSECGDTQGRHDMWLEGDLCGECYEMRPKCRGCQTKQEVSEQTDAYGYSTGYWCDSCYESDRYPYRRDRYFDESYAGERLEDDY